MFKQMKLGTKICAGFAIPIAVLIAISTFAYVQATSMEGVARLTKNETLAYAVLAQEMKLNVDYAPHVLSQRPATSHGVLIRNLDHGRRVRSRSLSRLRQREQLEMGNPPGIRLEDAAIVEFHELVSIR